MGNRCAALNAAPSSSTAAASCAANGAASKSPATSRKFSISSKPFNLFPPRPKAHSMPRKPAATKKPAVSKLFVLDTNVLMHDPSSIFRFEEHDIFLPIMTLEELDNNKKGMSEIARNARQTSRMLDELLAANGEDDIDEGIDLYAPSKKLASGRLYLQT